MKYDQLERNSYDSNESSNSIDNILAKDEKVLWRGKPQKKVFMLESITKMMPFALIWLAFDGFFIGMITKADIPSEMMIFMVFFFALHLMPVWLWLSQVISARRRYSNMEYCVTDRRIIIKGGFIGVSYSNILYKDITSVDVHIGLFDKIYKAGDITISTSNITSGKNSLANSIIDVEEPYEVMKLIQQTVVDIQSDISYPNAMRPDINVGYRTEYIPPENNDNN